ncbi:unnamed protein product [Eruca vesicaria subsp. sativa]|uniref:Uncharacterized protein n=1 Tax=Eruca vesicaria subsp. sativa TaxID=29727 RepID=A0ABC8J6H6_ERUVS|nr:unnamed protein product [Eruca vesicaria subsp. sativa]
MEIKLEWILGNDALFHANADDSFLIRNLKSSTHHSEVEIEPLCELTKLPWDAQIMVFQDVRSRFEQDSRVVRSMSPSKFLETLIILEECSRKK